MEKYIERTLLKKIIKYLPDRQILAILGPRQAGKTTLFKILQKHLLKENVQKNNIFFLTFEDTDIREQFNNNPKGFIEERLTGIQGRAYFFFDEYHWAKDGGQKLKLLFDLYSPSVKFLITGSSSLELTFQTGKFLVGRIFYFYLYPLSFAEFLSTKEKGLLTSYREINSKLRSLTVPKKLSIFDKNIKKSFEEFCLYGGYPEVVKSPAIDRKKILLKFIAQTYLEKDIRSLLLIDDIASFRKLLQILSAQIGQLLSYNQLSSDIGINFKLIKKYINIFEETYVAKRIAPFYQNISSELRKNPKLYFFDSGLRNNIIGLFAPLDIRIDKGALVENFVFTQLAKEEIIPNFWRTKSKAEVDFVLKKQGETIPIEVKYRKMGTPTLSRSYNSFISVYKPKTGIVLTNGLLGEIKRANTRVLFLPVWYC